MSSDVEVLIEDLQDIVGDALRIVATYGADDYQIHYVRGDVQETIPSKDPDRIHRELIMEGFSREYIEELFGAGDLECMAFLFAEALAIHFVGPDHTGLYVAVDPETFDPFPELTGRCEAFVS